MDIPDEMRAAVLAERCERYGHVPDIAQLLGNDPTVYPGEHTVRVRAKQADTIPHIVCKACGWHWLVTADGPTYDAAEDNLNAVLAPKNRRKLRRERRRERAAAEQAAAAAAQQAPAPAVEPAPAATPAAMLPASAPSA